MELSVREAATLLGRSPRTVRAQLARGELPGVKRKGRWQIARKDLPLTEEQRRAMQAKADALRSALESALPPRVANAHGQRHRSLADLDAFRYAAEVLAAVRQADPGVLDPPLRERLVELLEEALFELAEAVEQFEREIKLQAVRRVRSALARTVASLLLAAGIPPPQPLNDWVVALEARVLPAVAGFARWVDRLGKGPR